jgi:cytochrome c-type biogenesis protein CcmH/NrfG
MSNHRNTAATDSWTSTQAYTLAIVCLVLGVAGGWLFRGSQPTVAGAPTASTSPAPSAGNASGQPTPEQMKKMAQVSVAPLLEKLKADPNNADLLANIGNVYYDAQQFADAIQYYKQALEIQPANAAVRTDMATAIWYAGDADTAIQEFNKSLTYEPTKPNTLFNLGMVKWQGKMDIPGAIAVWQTLLKTNPNYEGKEKVKELIAQAKKHAGAGPGMGSSALPE